MTDIRAVFIDARMVSDYALDAGLLQSDDGLETAIIVSLFTDRRANPDDVLPDDATDRRGWWGDVAPPLVDGVPVDGDRIGSRLWLLSREKQLNSVVARAKAYAEEALAWLTEDGIAERIEVIAEIVRTSVLGLRVIVHRPDGDQVSFRFDNVWTSQSNGGQA